MPAGIEMPSDRQEELVMGLQRRGAIFKFGASLIMKSGLWTPYLINLRPALSFDFQNTEPVARQERTRDLLLDGFGDILDTLDFHHIFGAPEAGTPLAAAIAAKSGKSVLWERLVAKSRGAHEKLEGAYHQGEIIAQIDDVITKADTKKEVANNLSAHGLVSTDVVVGVDREQGGREAIEVLGMRLHSLIGATTMFDILHAHNELSLAQYLYLNEYTTSQEMTAEPIGYDWAALAD